VGVNGGGGQAHMSANFSDSRREVALSLAGCYVFEYLSTNWG